MGYEWKDKFDKQGQLSAAAITEMQSAIENIYTKFSCSTANSGYGTCPATTNCYSTNSSQKATTDNNGYGSGCYENYLSNYESNQPTGNSSVNSGYGSSKHSGGAGFFSVYNADTTDGNNYHNSSVCADYGGCSGDYYDYY